MESVDLSSASAGVDWNGYISWELGRGKNYAFAVDADVEVASESFSAVNMTI